MDLTSLAVNGHNLFGRQMLQDSAKLLEICGDPLKKCTNCAQPLLTDQDTKIHEPRALQANQGLSNTEKKNWYLANRANSYGIGNLKKNKQTLD